MRHYSLRWLALLAHVHVACAGGASSTVHDRRFVSSPLEDVLAENNGATSKITTSEVIIYGSLKFESTSSTSGQHNATQRHCGSNIQEGNNLPKVTLLLHGMYFSAVARILDGTVEFNVVVPSETILERGRRASKSMRMTAANSTIMAAIVVSMPHQWTGVRTVSLPVPLPLRVLVVRRDVTLGCAPTADEEEGGGRVGNVAWMGRPLAPPPSSASAFARDCSVCTTPPHSLLHWQGQCGPMGRGNATCPVQPVMGRRGPQQGMGTGREEWEQCGCPFPYPSSPPPLSLPIPLLVLSAAACAVHALLAGARPRKPQAPSTTSTHSLYRVVPPQALPRAHAAAAIFTDTALRVLPNNTDSSKLWVRLSGECGPGAGNEALEQGMQRMAHAAQEALLGTSRGRISNVQAQETLAFACLRKYDKKRE